MVSWQNNPEIKLFQEYLRIPSVHPDVDYEPCVKFLQTQAESLNLPLKVYYPGHPKKPVVVITCAGTHPELPTIVLNSHMDVVPVFEENWTHPPFGAEIDSEGRIFARGAQDMKCVGMQYLAAIRALQKDGVQFKRTIHIIFVPDEENNSGDGMEAFCSSTAFKTLNAAFALDEGIASPNDVFSVFNAERTSWHVEFHLSGRSGHGGFLPKQTVGEKLLTLLKKFETFRNSQVARLSNDPKLEIGDVTSINLTSITGGLQTNIIPVNINVGFDIRLAVDVDLKQFETELEKWAEAAGSGCTVHYAFKGNPDIITPTDNSNPFWIAFRTAFDENNLKYKTKVFPAATDGHYLRQKGVAVIGFSPMIATPILLHDHDEFIRAEVYLTGIRIYKKIIMKLTNV